MYIEDVEYRWKTKGTGSKVVVGQLKTSPDLERAQPTPRSHQLTTKDNTTVAESHSKRRSSFFRKARDMGLEISGVVALATDVILLTFNFVWKERQKGVKIGANFSWDGMEVPPSPLALRWVSDE